MDDFEGNPVRLLTGKEMALLAREVAADDAGWVKTCRTAFTHGWDAAMDYASRKASEGIERLDGDDQCCHFQD